jgi:hypothetical protein
VDGSILWRAAVIQALAVTAVSIVLALALPDSFFEDWGWLSGPVAWMACAAVTGRALRLPVLRVMAGAALAGILSAAAVIADLHWLGVAIAIGVFAVWCGWIAARDEAPGWT